VVRKVDYMYTFSVSNLNCSRYLQFLFPFCTYWIPVEYRTLWGKLEWDICSRCNYTTLHTM